MLGRSGGSPLCNTCVPRAPPCLHTCGELCCARGSMSALVSAYARSRCIDGGAQLYGNWNGKDNWMSKPIRGAHLYPPTFMGFPLIDSGPIKLPAAAPSPPRQLCLCSAGMGLTPLPAAGSHLPSRDVPLRSSSLLEPLHIRDVVLCCHAALTLPEHQPGLGAMVGSCAFPSQSPFSQSRGELHPPPTGSK